ncbi:hypothetical protein [Peterkaempfera sp. SMS 1(5)a]|uniref:hypothetical protein n=1 Tax=Peterkaempfera podocarpi TaxID=3232308 RepID=UPI0036715E99
MARALLRVHARTTLAGRPPHLSDLRVLLVADVLLRTAGLGGRQAMVGLGLPDDPAPGEVKALTRDAERLNVHPPAAQAHSRDVPAALGGPIHVEVSVPGAADATDGDAPRPAPVEVGPVDPGGTLDLPPDPLALRLALLGHTPAEPVRLTPEGLAEAAGTLTHWRRRVADWAGEPSRPAHAETVRAARAGFAEGLDTATALDLLHRLDRADEVPAGARFETFVHLDRVLALELARDIGR